MPKQPVEGNEDQEVAVPEHVLDAPGLGEMPPPVVPAEEADLADRKVVVEIREATHPRRVAVVPAETYQAYRVRIPADALQGVSLFARAYDRYQPITILNSGDVVVFIDGGPLNETSARGIPLDPPMGAVSTGDSFDWAASGPAWCRVATGGAVDGEVVVIIPSGPTEEAAAKKARPKGEPDHGAI